MAEVPDSANGPEDLRIDTMGRWQSVRCDVSAGSTYIWKIDFRLRTIYNFETCVSVPLVLEYESVAKREEVNPLVAANDVDDLIDYICRVSRRTEVFYTWRPQLRDPDDEMVLELAIGSRADWIVTFNKRDFAGTERFGIGLLTPVELLQKIGVLR